MKILIPTDFSPASKRAIELVMDHIKDLSGNFEIILLNTYMIKQDEPADIIQVNDHLKKRSKEGLEELRAFAMNLRGSPTVTIETASHMGSLNNVIRRLFHKHKIGLVALPEQDAEDSEKLIDMLKKENCLLLKA